MSILSSLLDPHRALRARAVSRLERAVRAVSGTVGIAMKGGSSPTDVVVFSGSLARATLRLEFSLPFSDDAGQPSLGASPLAWEGVEEFEPWYELSRPLADLPRIGKPDPKRPWVLLHTPRALDAAREVASEIDGQVHVLGGNVLRVARSRDVVYWPALPGAVLGLLGRAHRVLGETPLDPLVLDAQRAGLPTNFDEAPDRALSGVVPPSLFDDEQFWQHVASTLVKVRTGEAPSPLFTKRWIREGRRAARAASTTARVGSSWELVMRRYAKFRREPERYFADSPNRVTRAVGKWWFRRG